MTEKAKPTLVSLFTGAGGLDVGLELAGFKAVTAVDSDPECMATLRASQEARIRSAGSSCFLDGTRLLHARVEDLEPADLRPAVCGDDWVPDLMAGGPPCQPFS